MAVRPLNGLVSIAECTSRFEADAAVARLASAGIDAVVLGDPAHSVAPHLVTERGFSVLVAVAIADDANQVLIQGARPGGPVVSPLIHPTLQRWSGPAPAGPPLTSPGSDEPPTDAFDDTDDTDDERGPLRRPVWITVVAWLTVVSVLLPLVLGTLRLLASL
jgi:hypothetical protein